MRSAILAESSGRAKNLPVAEEMHSECWWSAFQLDLRQRVKPQDLNATANESDETRGRGAHLTSP